MRAGRPSRLDTRDSSQLQFHLPLGNRARGFCLCRVTRGTLGRHGRGASEAPTPARGRRTVVASEEGATPGGPYDPTRPSWPHYHHSPHARGDGRRRLHPDPDADRAVPEHRLPNRLARRSVPPGRCREGLAGGHGPVGGGHGRSGGHDRLSLHHHGRPLHRHRRVRFRHGYGGRGQRHRRQCKSSNPARGRPSAQGRPGQPGRVPHSSDKRAVGRRPGIAVPAGDRRGAPGAVGRSWGVQRGAASGRRRGRRHHQDQWRAQRVSGHPEGPGREHGDRGGRGQ